MTRLCLVMILAMSSLIIVSGCSSRVNSTVTSSTHPNDPRAIRWTDAQWDLTKSYSLPTASGRRRIKCGSSRICWVWDEHAVWTSNGGDDWLGFYQDSEKSIQSVHINSMSLAWIVKARTLYKTTDGGKSLERLIVGDSTTECRVSSIHFADQQHGWAVGSVLERVGREDQVPNIERELDKARISAVYETFDGGSSWKRRSIPRRFGSIDEIVFSSGGLGIVSNSASILLSRDSGQTWTDGEKHFPVSDDEMASYHSSFLFGDNVAWLLFSDTEFRGRFTNDAGSTWHQLTWTVPSQGKNATSYPPSPRFGFVDVNRGLFLYTHFDSTEVFKTSDGGKSWSQVNAVEEEKERFDDLVVLSGTEGLLLSNSGIYRFKAK